MIVVFFIFVVSPDMFHVFFNTCSLFIVFAGEKDTKDASKSLDNTETMPFDAAAVLLPEETIPSTSPDMSSRERREQYRSVKPPKSPEPTKPGQELEKIHKTEKKNEDFSDTDSEAGTAGFWEKVKRI